MSLREMDGDRVSGMMGAIKFDGKNFGVWKMKVKAYFEMVGLWCVLERQTTKSTDSELTSVKEEKLSSGGSSLASVSKQSTKELTEMKEKSMKAYTILILSLPTEQMQLIMHIGNGDAYGLWSTLVNHYERKSLATRTHIREQMLSCKMGENESIDVFKSKLLVLSMRMSDMGEKVSESELLFMMIRGLPSSYDSLVQTMKVAGVASMEEAANHVKDHQEFLAVKREDAHVTMEQNTFNKKRTRDTRSNSRDHVQNRRTKYSERTEQEKSYVCELCKKKGHYTSNCQLNKYRDDPGACFKCGSKKHRIKRCPENGSKEVSMTVKEDMKPPKIRNGVESTNAAFTASVSVTTSVTEGRCSSIVLDSGASRHFVNDRSQLSNVSEVGTPVKVTTANGNVVSMTECGKAKMQVDQTTTVTLNEATYAPQFAANLLSVAQIADTGAVVTFDKESARITRDGNVVLVVPRTGNLYGFGLQSRDEQASTAATMDDVWHRRLGHLSISGMKKLKATNAVDGAEDIPIHQDTMSTVCEPCVMGKMHRKPFGKQSNDRVDGVMDRVHADLCGPINTSKSGVVDTIGGGKYLSTIIDEKSRKIFGRIIKRKSEAINHVMDWHKQSMVETGRPLKIFRSDGGGEYISKELTNYFKTNGVAIEMTPKGTPQLNGIAERANRTLFEMTRSMLYQAQVSASWWGEAIMHSIYIRNRCITTENQMKTPEEVWSGCKPSIKHIKIFGCNAYAHIQDDERKKVDMKASRCMHVGYDESRKAYRVYDVDEKKLIVSRDVTFDESSSSLGRMQVSQEKMQVDSTEEQEYELIEWSPDHDQNQPVRVEVLGDEQQMIVEDNDALVQGRNVEVDEEPIVEVPARAQRIRVAPNRYGMVNYEDIYDLDQQHMFNSAYTAMDSEPKTYEEAISSADASKWKQAMEEELKALSDNKTWTEVELPAGRKPMDCKWIYKVKRNVTGEVDRYKARLVAKGYTQQYGIDYNETFAPVVKYKSLRIILAIATIMDYELEQLDVITAFLNAPIKEEVYMLPPSGDNRMISNRVYRLHKTIYGTRQAPHEWNIVMSNAIVSLGFEQCKADTCVYVKKTKTEHQIIISLFVDDVGVAFAAQDRDEWNECKQALKSKFAMKDMGTMNWILGIRVTRDRASRKLYLDQEQYITDVLKRYRMDASTPVSTPGITKQVTTNEDRSCTDGESEYMEQVPYAAAVGSLLYAAISTRIDISHAIGIATRYMAKPNKEQWLSVKRILRYLKGTASHKLSYSGGSGGVNGVTIKAYCDADWAGDATDRKSTTGMLVLIGDCVVSWLSKKQSVVALSTAESEYLSISTTVQEVMWIRQLLQEIGYPQQAPTTIYSDNRAAIENSRNDVGHSRMKHIDIRHHFIREAVKENRIDIRWIDTNHQLADVLTKSVTKIKFKYMTNRIMGINLNEHSQSFKEEC
jgi:Reverse transcriptase (RNA-dependent DNA polymerase)/gag-polypeptide of LTR copia-type/GAG-pre-integrase domain/Integrase core domain